MFTRSGKCINDDSGEKYVKRLKIANSNGIHIFNVYISKCVDSFFIQLVQNDFEFWEFFDCIHYENERMIVNLKDQADISQYHNHPYNVLTKYCRKPKTPVDPITRLAITSDFKQQKKIHSKDLLQLLSLKHGGSYFIKIKQEVENQSDYIQLAKDDIQELIALCDVQFVDQSTTSLENQVLFVHSITWVPPWCNSAIEQATYVCVDASFMATKPYAYSVLQFINIFNIEKRVSLSQLDAFS